MENQDRSCLVTYPIRTGNANAAILCDGGIDDVIVRENAEGMHASRRSGSRLWDELACNSVVITPQRHRPSRTLRLSLRNPTMALLGTANAA